MEKKYFFVDAETDGLYGDFLSVAAIVCDESAEEISRFYGYVECDKEDINSDWVKENVYPYLPQGDKDIVVKYSSESELLDAFWEYYESNQSKEVFCIADVLHPVESRLFTCCVKKTELIDSTSDISKGPFPLLDIASMLYGIGVDPLTPRISLVDCQGLHEHNALDDVRMSIRVWKKYFVKREEL